MFFLDSQLTIAVTVVVLNRSGDNNSMDEVGISAIQVNASLISNSWRVPGRYCSVPCLAVIPFLLRQAVSGICCCMPSGSSESARHSPAHLTDPYSKPIRPRGSIDERRSSG